MDNSIVPQVKISRIATKSEPISEWFICGPFSNKENDRVNCLIERFNKCNFKDDFYDFDTLRSTLFHDVYKSKFELLDLSELYDIPKGEEKYHENETSIMVCDLISENDISCFLRVNTKMKCEQWLNGNKLNRIKVNGQNNFYHVKLNAGVNRFVVKVTPYMGQLYYDMRVCDSVNVVKDYVGEYSNKIILPLISSKTKEIELLSNHSNVINVPATISITDVYGNLVFRKRLVQDSVKYIVNKLQSNSSYLCELSLFNQSVLQPILCGNAVEIYNAFLKRRESINLSNDYRLYEIDGLLYRLKFLLNDNYVERNFDWQFKIPTLTYQLEQLFSNISFANKTSDNNFNIQYKSYISELDGGVQRYLLATPNKINKNSLYPLVVVVRPSINKHHHFFSSPQIARQSSIDEMQMLANKYNYIVIMPEARMYLSEDLIPFGEAEIKLAIKDVQKNYPIDKNRIYLHSNCDGGYRALKLAMYNPGMFAAIALYGPTYIHKHTSEELDYKCPEHLFQNLNRTPIYIQGDPDDEHSKYSNYSQLIEECGKNSIPYVFKLIKRSGYKYNKQLVGEEAFAFFKNKESQTITSSINVDDSCIVIEDLYSNPFIYVKSTTIKNKDYEKKVHEIVKEYNDYFMTQIPIVNDIDVTEDLLNNKNVYLIGDSFNNINISKELKNMNDDVLNNYSISIQKSEKYSHLWILHDITRNNSIQLKYPWINGIHSVY